MPNKENLKPCPFCGDPMVVEGQLLKHREQTPECPIAAMAMPVEYTNRWQARAPEWNANMDEAPRDGWNAGVHAAARVVFTIQDEGLEVFEKLDGASALNSLCDNLYANILALSTCLPQPPKEQG